MTLNDDVVANASLRRGVWLGRNQARDATKRAKYAGVHYPSWIVRSSKDADAITIAPLYSAEEQSQRRLWYTYAGLQHRFYDWTLQEPPYVIILRGAPGTGKSTWAARYKAMHPTETIVLSATDYFRGRDGIVRFRADRLQQSHAWCRNFFGLLIERCIPRIVLDNTHMALWEYDGSMGAAFRQAYRVFQHVCTGTFQNTSHISEQKVQAMRKRFEQDNYLPHYQVDADGY